LTICWAEAEDKTAKPQAAATPAKTPRHFRSLLIWFGRRVEPGFAIPWPRSISWDLIFIFFPGVLFDTVLDFNLVLLFFLFCLIEIGSLGPETSHPLCGSLVKATNHQWLNHVPINLLTVFHVD
jgi:hypothetical protein